MARAQRFLRGLASSLTAFALVQACAKPQASRNTGAAAAVQAADPGPAGGNLLKNSGFDDGTSLPWTTSFSAPASGSVEVEGGAACLTIDNAGANKWDAQIRHREMVIQRGHQYTVAFTAWATKPVRLAPKVGMAGPPYAEYWNQVVSVGPNKQRFIGKFTMNRDDDPTAELAFHAGGNLLQDLPVTICLDDIRLDDPQFRPQATAAESAVPNLVVNQLGYLPSFAKFATVKSNAANPLQWSVLDAEGNEVLSGQTRVFGGDAASAEDVHGIDLSELRQPGSDYVLKVGDETSVPFDVAKDLYRKLKYDALAYFYHNRSGIEIKLPHAREARWARRAGHLPDRAACAPKTGCDYALDVTGGWYDAGDHGKYVVNGGISVWTLQNLWERAKHLNSKKSRDFADRKLNIPESGNRFDDLLDEARWELEFLLKMQVPQGRPLAGMVHHKVHDDSWTALGLEPADDPKTRYLRPVSTAATLNVAAVAAQGARIWQASDAKFSARLLQAAELAWAAARKYPAKFAPASDSQGGGPYDDDAVDDEFYWAAVELFLTTGKPLYREAFQANPHHRAFKQKDGYLSLMTWQVVDALGVISLAIVPQAGKEDAQHARARLQAAADMYLKHIEAQGYRTPFHPGPSYQYPWGSNSFVLNNMMVLALAHDFSKDAKYLHATAEGMDYLLGRNPLGISYITGYGERAVQHPHHRFWAQQVDSRFPPAPPGCVSGGPNSGLQDPYVQAAGLKGCAPAKCFIDHIEAWSTNEITINWNAPLAWVAAFLDERAN